MHLKHKKLKKKLDRLCNTYDASYLFSDPLKFLHNYEAPEDQEVVGLIASSLAYGRVRQILKSIDSILEIMGKSPAGFVRNFNPVKDPGHFDGFVHRFNNGEDVACLIWFMKQVLDEYGALENLFVSLDHKKEANIKKPLSYFTDFILKLDSSPFYGGASLPSGAGVRYFFPSPEKGSACKRLNLFLRWMVRKKDGVDMGLWTEINPSRLVMPLDTHISRISLNIGLTNLKTPGWTMAEDITEKLKELDPGDPVRYDFALCRLGILDLCPQKKKVEKCSDCNIREICIL